MVSYSSRYWSSLIVPQSQLDIKNEALHRIFNHLTDRKFSNIKIVCVCALKSDKTSLIGTHCSKIR